MTSNIWQIVFYAAVAVLFICSTIQWFKNLPVLNRIFFRIDPSTSWMTMVPFGRTALFFTYEKPYNTVLKYTLFIIPYVLLIGILVSIFVFENSTIMLLCAGFMTIYLIEMGTVRDKFFKANDLKPFDPILFGFMFVAFIILVIYVIMNWINSFIL